MDIMKRCTECALLFENRQVYCPQCGRLLIKEKKSPQYFAITVFSILLAIIIGILVSFSSFVS